MEALRYALLDVFTTKPFGGNQLAVFYDDTNLPTETMQTIARELNLSETVFVQTPSDAKKEKRLRIFTPKVELPMAGHPTIGTAYLLADKGILDTKEGVNEWVLEEEVGEIPVKVYREQSRISKVEMTQPLPEFGEVYQDRQNVADLFSLSVEDLDPALPIQTVSTGVPFLFIPICTLDAIKKIQFRMDIWEKHFSRNPEIQHIFTFTTETENISSTIHSRMFAPAMGISEDPATGNASGSLGAYLVEHAVVSPVEQETYFIRSEQGFEMGRPSYIDITIGKEGEQYKEVKIGGTSVIIGSGEICLQTAD
ncbi:PhzF family phenazine biosynthesis protein [Shimazuella kribbensis]|uniref:PhzF family phenazine biosynthesis protein n=1 Tax=Shimazuella kribbensis TaxID=139808 RepID=UPI00040D549A|nr:PhzF family phenazine biosynthesis protein [Shimazuella kribbensis]